MTPQDQGCFRLFRVFGITVLLHWSWFLVAVIEIQARRDAYPSLLWNAGEYLALFVIVLLHEFGHALACRQVGGTAERIVLWPLGGIAYVDPPARPGALLWSIAAGPLVNVVLVPVTLGLGLLAGYVAPPEMADHVARICIAIAWINIALLIFNILPIYPLDGGQILHALLWFVIGRARSLMACGVIGVIGAAGLGLLAIYSSSIWVMLIAVFLGMRAVAGIRLARAMTALQPATEHLEAAVVAGRQGDVIGAVSHCDQALGLIPAGHPLAGAAYAARGMIWASAGEHHRALGDFNEAIRLRPEVAWYRASRGLSYVRLGEYRQAEEDYVEALAIDDQSAVAMNNLAWLLATCPDPGVRDGRRAVEQATRACQLTGWKEPACLGTLAAAYAETCDFETAISWQKKALEDPGYREMHGQDAEARLAMYADRRPYREELPGWSQ